MDAARSALARARQRWATPVVQHDAADCGPAALLQVLRLHGGDARLVDLRRAAGTNATGTTLLGLKEAAESVGFTAQGARGSYDDLRQCAMPCIAHLVVAEGRHHFVTLTQVGATGVHALDPARGRVQWTREEFEAQWVSRSVLLLTPGQRTALRTAPSAWRFWRALLATVSPWLTQAVFLGAAAGVLAVGTAALIRKLLDAATPEGSLAVVTSAALIVAGSLAIRAVILAVRQYFAVELTVRLGEALRRRFLDVVYALDWRDAASRTRADLAARSRDVTQVQTLITEVATTFTVDGTVVLATVIGLAFIDGTLAALAAVGGVGLGLVLALALRRLVRLQRAQLLAQTQVETAMLDAIELAGDARALRRDAWAKARATAPLAELASAARLTGAARARLGATAEFVVAAVLAAGLVVAGASAQVGALTPGDLVASYALLTALVSSVGRLAESAGALHAGRLAVDRFLELGGDGIATAADAAGAAGDADAAIAERREAPITALHLDGTAFHWPGRPQTLLLQPVHASFEVGTLHLLVGPSGSGKSTLLRLLAGIYPPTVGRVALSPRDEAPTPDRIALAPDAPAILRASLYENLVLGRDDLTPALVEAWLRAHGLAPFFTRFEQGLATIVGEGARPLSRGERQVLSIVRVLLTAPGAVVADEVIDPLDPELTALVLQLLDTAARTRVVVLSTQRQDLAATDRQVWRLEAGVLRHVDAADRHAARQIPTSRSA